MGSAKPRLDGRGFLHSPLSNPKRPSAEPGAGKNRSAFIRKGRAVEICACSKSPPP